jgi:hypothetical protein
MNAVLGAINGALNEDPDRLLGYHTRQQVNVMDRVLGITQYLLQFAIAMYIVVYIFIIAEGYVEVEGSIGLLSVHTFGDVVGRSSGGQGTRFFPADEITYPGLENGNLFVATKVETMNQKRGVCEDKNMRCLSADDCSKEVDAECTENKLCKEPSWCDIEKEQPEIYKLATSDLRIWVKSAIQFVELDNGQVFANQMESPIMWPAADYNTFTVKDLLTLCDPPVRFEEISELGAAIEVQMVWKCNVVSGKCETKPRARRVDTLLNAEKIGFTFTWPVYTGKDKRMENKMSGIRFYLRTVGTGYKVSIAEIIMKLSTGAALLGFAPIIADLMMTNCFRHSKKYEARKYVYSEDLSDYFDKLAEMQGQEEVLSDDAQDAEDEQEDEEWRRRMDEEDE